MFRKIKPLLRKGFDRLLKYTGIDNNLIVFESFQSSKYSDSPRAIYEKIINDDEYKGYRFAWVFTEPSRYEHLKSSRTRVVKFGGLMHRVLFARAKYWVINGWTPRYIHENKKTGQVVLQCWHGTPLKRLRADVEAINGRANRFMSDVPSYDYFISPSAFATEVFESAFKLGELNPNCKVIETGYPRNDKLVKYTSDIKRDIRKSLGLPDGKKVLLYAPTWRDGHKDSQKKHIFNLQFDVGLLRSRLGEEWVILFKAHYFISNQMDFTGHEEFIYDISHLEDISDLYIVSDMLVTDYSSVFFDFAILERPIVFYMYDLEDYRDRLRGFYLDLEELPGDIVYNESEIADIALSINEYKDKYREMTVQFNKRFNYNEDGGATERVLESFLS